MIWHKFWGNEDEGGRSFEKKVRVEFRVDHELNLGLPDSFSICAASILVRNTTHSAFLFGFHTRSTGIRSEFSFAPLLVSSPLSIS